MKRNKRIAAIFLGISLVSATDLYSYELFNKASIVTFCRFVKNNDFLRKAIPFALFVSLVGYYYWINNNGKSNTKPEDKKPSEDTKQPTVIKYLSVYGQFNGDGGGGASCGYHTLLRGMQAAKENDNLKNDLMDTEPIAKYFGKDGDKYFGKDGKWRKKVIEYRKKQAIKKLLHENFLSAFRDKNNIENYNEKIKELYTSSFGWLEDRILNDLQNSNGENLSYDFTADEAIQNRIEKGIFSENKNLVDEAQSPETMKKYLDFNKMRKELLCENGSIKALIIGIQEKHESGELLSDGEMELLWREKVQSMAPNNCGFTAISNFNLIDQEGFDEVAPIINETVIPKLNQDYCHIFAIGTMEQHGDKNDSGGHWFPLVMKNQLDQNSKQYKRSYAVMDSAGCDLTEDEHVKKLIGLIEKK